MSDVGDDWGDSGAGTATGAEVPGSKTPSRATATPSASSATGSQREAPASAPTATPASESSDGQSVKQPVVVQGRLEGSCIHCKVAMGHFLGTMTPEGPIHNECIPAYKRGLVERCVHCDCVLRETRTILNGKKLHPECVADFKAKKPFVPPAKNGLLQKFAIGRSTFGSKNWKERFFVLSKETGLAYYESQEAFSKGLAPKGTVPLSPQTRMITHPTRLIHKEALNPSTEFIIVFFEQNQERRLLVAAKTWQEHDEWTRTLESYIKIVDDPKDIAE